MNMTMNMAMNKNRNMESLLARLFDFQRFEKNEALQSVIDETEERFRFGELSEDDLEQLSAAGDPYSRPPDAGAEGARL